MRCLVTVLTICLKICGTIDETEALILLKMDLKTDTAIDGLGFLAGLHQKTQQQTKKEKTSLTLTAPGAKIIPQ